MMPLDRTRPRKRVYQTAHQPMPAGLKGVGYTLIVARKRYRKKPDQSVTAVQVNLDVRDFVYRKWGGMQRCKPGDWLVDNEGDVYTVDGEVFSATYRQLSPGVYLKITPVYAERATRAGTVKTKEGESSYNAGDYIVSNNADGSDAYCIEADKFEAMYEPDE